MANRVWSTLTEKERDEDAIYQKGYADGRKCMALHIKRMQKKIAKLEKKAILRETKWRIEDE
jgi:hypothetical protein